MEGDSYDLYVQILCAHWAMRYYIPFVHKYARIRSDLDVVRNIVNSEMIYLSIQDPLPTTLVKIGTPIDRNLWWKVSTWRRMCTRGHTVWPLLFHDVSSRILAEK